LELGKFSGRYLLFEFVNGASSLVGLDQKPHTTIAVVWGSVRGNPDVFDSKVDPCSRRVEPKTDSEVDSKADSKADSEARADEKNRIVEVVGIVIAQKMADLLWC